MSRRETWMFEVNIQQPNERVPEEVMLVYKIGGLLENFWKMSLNDRDVLMDLIKRNVDE